MHCTAHTERTRSYRRMDGIIIIILYILCYAPFNKLALNTLSEHLTQLRSAYGISLYLCDLLLVFVCSAHGCVDQEHKQRPFCKLWRTDFSADLMIHSCSAIDDPNRRHNFSTTMKMAAHLNMKSQAFAASTARPTHFLSPRHAS